MHLIENRHKDLLLCIKDVNEEELNEQIMW